MLSDIDIYRSAYVLIEQHGADASVQAAMKADKFFSNGDLQADVIWQRIVRAVEHLMSTTPPEGAKLS
ncbi:MAG: hypothetical protein WAN51_13735 [Alphaproteobacteria bacterium]